MVKYLLNCLSCITAGCCFAYIFQVPAVNNCCICINLASICKVLNSVFAACFLAARSLADTKPMCAKVSIAATKIQYIFLMCVILIRRYKILKYSRHIVFFSTKRFISVMIIGRLVWLFSYSRHGPKYVLFAKHSRRWLLMPSFSVFFRKNIVN